MPFARLRNRKRRHTRSSAFSRRLFRRWTPAEAENECGKTEEQKPAENFESSAAPKARPNRRIVPRDGDRHMLAKAHNVSTKNNVIAMSVRTKGPNASMTGMVA